MRACTGPLLAHHTFNELPLIHTPTQMLVPERVFLTDKPQLRIVSIAVSLAPLDAAAHNRACSASLCTQPHSHPCILLTPPTHTLNTHTVWHQPHPGHFRDRHPVGLRAQLKGVTSSWCLHSAPVCSAAAACCQRCTSLCLPSPTNLPALCTTPTGPAGHRRHAGLLRAAAPVRLAEGPPRRRRRRRRAALDGAGV